MIEKAECEGTFTDFLVPLFLPQSSVKGSLSDIAKPFQDVQESAKGADVSQISSKHLSTSSRSFSLLFAKPATAGWHTSFVS